MYKIYKTRNNRHGFVAYMYISYKSYPKYSIHLTIRKKFDIIVSVIEYVFIHIVK